MQLKNSIYPLFQSISFKFSTINKNLSLYEKTRGSFYLLRL